MVRAGHAEEFFDVVVVGSGFGGSVVTSTVADGGLTVCLLERGQAHPPGTFGRSPHAVAANLWDPSERLHGMFDIWSFARTEAIVSSGLGGGSLIYANVLLRKDREWFYRHIPGQPDEPWPIDYDDLVPHYEAVEDVLLPERYPLTQRPTAKTEVLKTAAGRLGLDWSTPPLAITFRDRPGTIFDDGSGNMHGVPRLSCRGSGECDLGCNLGAKNTLDLTYLSTVDRSLADIRADSEVRAFRDIDGGWEVDWVRHTPHDPDVRSEDLPIRRVRCRALVLSAGTLGTNYLLLKNRAALPRLSDRLGAGFSGNGDFLAMLSGAVPDVRPSDGPVITSTLRIPDRRDGGPGSGIYIQDGGYPALVEWVNELVPPFGLVGRGAQLLAARVHQAITSAPPTRVSRQLARLLDGGRQSSTILPLLAMGTDAPDSVLSLQNGYLALDQKDGSGEFVTQVRATLKRIAEVTGSSYHDYMSTILSRYVTVHPLGGAAMGHSARDGVVDDMGRAFGYRGLFVADGSVLPGPVGANPSLTIAAVARRTALGIVEELAA